MQKQSNTTSHSTLTIRIGQNSFAFLVQEGSQGKRESTTFDTKGRMSISANLREAFQTIPLLKSAYDKTIVLADVATLIVPEEEFNEEDAEIMFSHAFSGYEHDAKKHISLPGLHAEIVFSISKDILTVIGDHFPNYQVIPVCYPVWLSKSQNSSTSGRQQLHAYFHDGKVDVFCINKHRFKFCNTFGATHEHDVLYYLLNAFTQLGFQSNRDEIIILGLTPHKKWIIDNLKQYVNRVSAPELSIVEQNGQQPLPYDLSLLSNQQIIP